MAKYAIGGKEYELRLDLSVLEKIEEEYGGMREAFEQMKGGKGRIAAIRQMFTWMANAAAEYAGREERITGDELKHADMAEFAALSEAIRVASMESTHAETIRGGEADRGTYDGYLAQIDAEEKKKVTAQ